ncbi:MAG: DUF3574 domain-containing protein [Chloroflexota bacterium]|nr:DUF3574 domain-containing protein [Chloroflexota bacterium]
MTDRWTWVNPQWSPGSPRVLVMIGLVLITIMAGAIAGPLGVAGSGAPVPAGDQSVNVNVQDATPVVPSPIASEGCDEVAPGVGSEPWIRTELYFGTTKPDGDELTDEEWQAFLDEEITPRFPAGLTVLQGYGQFLNSSGVIAQEGSIVLILFHPADVIEESSASIEEIRDAYEVAFEQESVLRADSAPVCISF